MAKRGGGCLRVGLLVILVPIVFGLGVLLVSNLNRVLTHDTTEGIIVDIEWSTDSDGDPSAKPIYEYRVDGEVYRYPSGISYGGVLVPSIGETRTILYDPSNPSDARVRSMFVLVWLPIILMAIPLLIVGFIFWRMARRRRMSDAAPPWADQIPGEQPQWGGGSQTPPWNRPTGRPAEQERDRQAAPGWQAVEPDAQSVIEAIFMGTEPSQMDDKGRVRYRVKARAEIDGEIQRYRSEWMDEDPTLYYMQHGNKVEVRINRANAADYEVILPPTG